jgi:hypothetical protein
VLPTSIPFNVFLLEDPHDDGAEKRKNKTDGQKLQLPYHGDTPACQDGQSLTHPEGSFQGGIFAAAPQYLWNQFMTVASFGPAQASHCACLAQYRHILAPPALSQSDGN